MQTRALNPPGWALHGLKHDVVHPNDIQHCIDTPKQERPAHGLDTTVVRLTHFPDANHDAWDRAFAAPELPGWVISHTAKPRDNLRSAGPAVSPPCNISRPPPR